MYLNGQPYGTRWAPSEEEAKNWARWSMHKETGDWLDIEQFSAELDKDTDPRTWNTETNSWEPIWEDHDVYLCQNSSVPTVFPNREYLLQVRVDCYSKSKYDYRFIDTKTNQPVYECTNTQLRGAYSGGHYYECIDSKDNQSKNQMFHTDTLLQLVSGPNYKRIMSYVADAEAFEK